MLGIICKKVGMTSIYDNMGNNLPCTIVKTGINTITQIKKNSIDGYDAVQMSYDEKKVKNTKKSLLGHFNKANVKPKKKIFEFRNFKNFYNENLFLGKEIKIENIFSEGDLVNFSGFSKGKGFQGVVKRHNFRGVGEATHGQHNRQRSPGSIGGCSHQTRVFKGIRMAGRMGGNKVKILNLKIIKIFSEKNFILVNGCIPGAKNSYVILQKSKI